MNKQKNESMEVMVARIDTNVGHLMKKIDHIKENLKDHEDRIRDNEKFKNKTIGAIAILSFVITVIVLLLCAVLTGGG